MNKKIFFKHCVIIKHIIYVFHNIFSEYYSPSSKPNYIFDIFGYFSSIFDLIYFFFFYQTFTQHSTTLFHPISCIGQLARDLSSALRNPRLEQFMESDKLEKTKMIRLRAYLPSGACNKIKRRDYG